MSADEHPTIEQLLGQQPAEPLEELLEYRPVRLAPSFMPLRAVLILLLLLLFLVLRLPGRQPALLWTTWALAVLSVPAIYRLERRGLLDNRLYRWIIPLTDIVLITLLHLGSCGAASPLFPLFYLPIVYAGLMHGYIGGISVAAGASGIYALLYALYPVRPAPWIILVVVLLFPAAGSISGYLGRYLARLNSRGLAILAQAERMHHEVEERRTIYERWYRAVDRLKADFVYSASHELRTPLTPIKGYLQMMLSPGLALPEDKVRDVLQIMTKNVDMLAQLVDDIIYLQRITRIPIDLEEVNLSTVAQQAMEEVSVELEEAKVQIRLDSAAGLPTVLGSSDSLKLVLTNLLEAAIRDSPEGSEVRLELQPAGEGVQVHVEGAGRGIPTEQQERIFDLFFHADSSPTYVLGREGLSLAVARYIVEMHGGQVAVQSQSRGGLVFTVSLPGRM